MTPNVVSTYSFGDSDLEAQRLDLLDQVFGPASRSLLADARIAPPSLAYDLGAGVGRTTRMVAEVTGAQRTVGLELSPAHVARASVTPAAGTCVLEWDITSVPFPAGPAELIYSRLLLAHLSDPVTVVASWATQLRCRGVIVVDEIEWIETDEPALRAHLDLAAAMIATAGACMCVGPALADMSNIPGLTQRWVRVVEVPVLTSAAASMFAMSLDNWGDKAVAASLCSRAELAHLRDALSRLRAPSTSSRITWGLHQAICERMAAKTRS